MTSHCRRPSFKYSSKTFGWWFGRCNSSILFVSPGRDAKKNATGYDGSRNGSIRVKLLAFKSFQSHWHTLLLKVTQCLCFSTFIFVNCHFSVGMVSTLKHIYNENGIVRGLYRGMSINYLRAIPMVAVSFSTYEVLKQALNLDTGMKI